VISRRRSPHTRAAFWLVQLSESSYRIVYDSCPRELGGRVPVSGRRNPAPDHRITTNTQIGALGLVPKHAFMYFFDYGDSHEFTVTVMGSELRADGGSYPRVVESRGEAPPQYHAYDEE